MSLLGLAAPTAQAQDPDPCALITAAEIRSALGTAPGAATAQGPTVDRDPDLTRWHCDRQVGAYFVVVTVYQFASPSGAADAMRMMLDEVKADKDMIQVTESPGIGDRAAGGASEEGAMWIALKGRHMLVLTLAGELSDPQRMVDPTRRLIVAGVGRLR